MPKRQAHAAHINRKSPSIRSFLDLSHGRAGGGRNNPGGTTPAVSEARRDGKDKEDQRDDEGEVNEYVRGLYRKEIVRHNDLVTLEKKIDNTDLSLAASVGGALSNAVRAEEVLVSAGVDTDVDGEGSGASEGENEGEEVNDDEDNGESQDGDEKAEGTEEAREEKTPYGGKDHEVNLRSAIALVSHKGSDEAETDSGKEDHQSAEHEVGYEKSAHCE